MVWKSASTLRFDAWIRTTAVGALAKSMVKVVGELPLVIADPLPRMNAADLTEAPGVSVPSKQVKDWPGLTNGT